jgi:hypothetical protein
MRGGKYIKNNHSWVNISTNKKAEHLCPAYIIIKAPIRGLVVMMQKRFNKLLF